MFLVDSGWHACKYLQSQQEWLKSIVYAKVTIRSFCVQENFLQISF